MHIREVNMAKKKQIGETQDSAPSFVSDMTPMEPVQTPPSNSPNLIPALDALVGRSYEIVGQSSPDADGAVTFHVQIDGSITKYTVKP